MNQLITSPEGLNQLLYVPSNYSLRDVIFDPENNLVDRELLLEQHLAKYGDRIKLPKWKEAVLAIPGKDLNTLNISKPSSVVTTSYMAQAVRQNLADAEAVLPITIEGIIESSDGQIMLGIRQGFIQNGKMSALPVGYLGTNSVLEQFYQETEEEIGLGQEHYNSTLFLGYQTDPEFTHGINFVVLAQVGLTAAKIIEIHQRSVDIGLEAIHQVMETTKDKSQARAAGKKAIHAAGYTNIDAGDNYPLVPIEIGNIEKILNEQNINLDGQKYPLMGICQGGLALYLQHLKQ